MSKGIKIGLYADGNYEGRCAICEKLFVGDKRALHCLRCAAIQQQAEIDMLRLGQKAQQHGYQVLQHENGRMRELLELALRNLDPHTVQQQHAYDIIKQALQEKK